MGLWQVLFGETTAENTVSNVISTTSSIVAETTQTCHQSLDIAQIVNLNHCSLKDVHINMYGKGVVNMACVQTAVHDLSSDIDVQNVLSQIAQATAQGLGLAASQSKNVLSNTVNLANTIFSTIDQSINSSAAIAQVVGCDDSSLDGVYIDMSADVGVDGSGVQNAQTVIAARTALTNTVDQYAKAESKDIFALLANMGTMTMMAIAFVAAATIAAFAFMGSTATKSAFTLIQSPMFWGGLLVAGCAINAMMYAKNMWFYSEASVPLRDGSVDPDATKQNKTLFWISEATMAAGIVIVGGLTFMMYRSQAKKPGTMGQSLMAMSTGK